MGVRVGSGYLGSPDIQISVAEQEILPNPPRNWLGKYNFYKFSFMNLNNACHISINNGDWIYLASFIGINTDYVDLPIFSFRIQENNISYYWIGCY